MVLCCLVVVGNVGDDTVDTTLQPREKAKALLLLEDQLDYHTMCFSTYYGWLVGCTRGFKHSQEEWCLCASLNRSASLRWHLSLVFLIGNTFTKSRKCPTIWAVWWSKVKFKYRAFYFYFTFNIRFVVFLMLQTIGLWGYLGRRIYCVFNTFSKCVTSKSDHIYMFTLIWHARDAWECRANEDRTWLDELKLTRTNNNHTSFAAIHWLWYCVCPYKNP